VTILLGKSLESINCDSKVLQVPKEHPTSSVKLLKQPKCGRQQKHSFTDCSVYDQSLWHSGKFQGELQRGRIYDEFRIHKQCALYDPQHGNNEAKTA
jgi:hypothetical protein